MCHRYLQEEGMGKAPASPKQAETKAVCTNAEALKDIV